MELRQLHYFIAIAEACHFRKAAESLRIAQPALSRQMKSLEDELGVLLFERTSRGALLTKAGRGLFEDAKRIIQDVKLAEERARILAEGHQPVLRIALSDALSAHPVVTEAIRHFRAASPRVDLALQSMTSAQQFAALRQRQIEAGFAFRPPQESPGIAHLDIAQLNLLLAIPASHPLAAAAHPRIAQLRDEPLICVARQINTVPHDKLLRACRKAGFVPRIIQEANSTVILDLVAAGMGIGIISSGVRSRLPAGVVLKSIAHLCPAIAFDLIWRDDDTSIPLMSFVDVTMAAKSHPTGSPHKRAPPARRPPI